MRIGAAFGDATLWWQGGQLWSKHFETLCSTFADLVWTQWQTQTYHSSKKLSDVLFIKIRHFTFPYSTHTFIRGFFFLFQATIPKSGLYRYDFWLSIFSQCWVYCSVWILNIQVISLLKDKRLSIANYFQHRYCPDNDKHLRCMNTVSEGLVHERLKNCIWLL